MHPYSGAGCKRRPTEIGTFIGQPWEPSNKFSTLTLVMTLSLMFSHRRAYIYLFLLLMWLYLSASSYPASQPPILPGLFTRVLSRLPLTRRSDPKSFPQPLRAYTQGSHGIFLCIFPINFNNHTLSSCLIDQSSASHNVGQEY